MLDPLALVHLELLPGLPAMLARVPALPGEADEHLTPEQVSAVLPELRTALAANYASDPCAAKAAPAFERWVPGPEGSPDVRVFVIGAVPEARRPAILHMHGGGFIIGEAADFLPALQVQSLALNCVIVTVDYRLAPETPFPGALQDNYAALRWLYANAEELGVDRSRIAVQGESAGGGHAAMLAIAARDRGEVPLVLQALTYPMLDDRTGSTRQPPSHIGNFGWSAKFNRIGWGALLGMPAGSKEAPRGAVPARVEDLSGLPPAFIAVGSIDLFVEEDIEYARRLILAGVPAELLVLPGAYHGFDNTMPESASTRAYNLAMFNALARAFGTPTLVSVPPLITQTAVI